DSKQAKLNDKGVLVVTDDDINVEISKVGLGGKEIAGAKIEIKKAGKVVERWTSAAGKTHVWKNVAEGDYEFHEIAAPKGYQKVTVIKFHVDAKGNVTVNDSQASAKGGKLVVTDEVSKVKAFGKKIWVDNNNQDGLRPDKVIIHLYKNGKDTGKTAIASKDNKWSYAFMNLPVLDENGKTIKYSVKEEPVSDYKTKYSDPKETKGNIEINVTNTHKPGVTQVEGKKTWNDNNNQDGLRPTEITIRLYDGKDEVKHVTVTAKDKWKYSFTNLPVNKNGKKIVYTIKEDKVKDYTTSIDGFNVTNTHKPGVTQVEGKKTWKDNNNQDGLRP
ncbi:Cna B-type domain-containing protein, partial [Ligilactobacillus ceti]|uniref:Cna B-type domain-containing protein n=1 Tax=Ligilactobacillus ceti TaxID=395085 RepID=UPI00128EAEFD